MQPPSVACPSWGTGADHFRLRDALYGWLGRGLRTDSSADLRGYPHEDALTLYAAGGSFFLQSGRDGSGTFGWSQSHLSWPEPPFHLGFAMSQQFLSRWLHQNFLPPRVMQPVRRR
jgi:hypothetical protein